MPPKVVFFFTYRRRIGGKPFNFGSCPKEGVLFGKYIFFFFHSEEEIFDHIFLNCARTKTL